MDTESVTGGDVLLIEKYGVVATAIVSALKRFAPSYKFHIAPSLHGAEVLATKTAPELFVIDFDPPEEGAIGFLTRMRAAHSTARVLVITPGISREVAVEAAGKGALHFLEKPFEVTNFGDAVELLLNLRRARGRKEQKELRALHLVDLLHLLCSAGSTSVILSENARDQYGEVHIYDGQICHAVCGNLTGLDALQIMFTWHEARFGEGRKGVFFSRTIEGAWSEIIIDALRKAKVAEDRGVPEPPSVPEVKPVDIPSGKKILVIDDAEMLLVFVEATLRDSDSTRQVTTACLGMEGLKQAQQINLDLILLDYCLPDVNGDEVCQALLSSETTAQIPVVLMSSMVPEITAAALRFPNVVATIAKPFLSGQLSALVEKTLAAGGIPLAKEAVSSSQIPAPSAAVTKEAVFSQEIPAPAIAESISPSARTPEEMLVGNGSHLTQEPFPPRSFELQEQDAPNPKEATDITFAQLQSEQPAPVQTFSGPASTSSRNEAIILLPLDVTAMQLSSLLQINALRAKPASASVSLQILSPQLQGLVSFETGFALEAVTLNVDGRIVEARLVPTLSPGEEIAPRGRFEIGQVTVGANGNDRIRLISAASAAMTVQLLLHFQFSAVDVSKGLQIAAVILRGCRDSAAVTLDQPTQVDDQSRIPCTMTAIQLDSFSRITELSLTPNFNREAALASGR